MGKWYPVKCSGCGRESEALGKNTVMLHATCPERKPGKAAPVYVQIKEAK